MWHVIHVQERTNNTISGNLEKAWLLELWSSLIKGQDNVVEYWASTSNLMESGVLCVIFVALKLTEKKYKDQFKPKNTVKKKKKKRKKKKKTKNQWNWDQENNREKST